jgi:hypothetical protein
VLAVFYFDPLTTIVCYAGMLFAEVLDQILTRQARTWNGTDPLVGRRLLKRITINTVISAVAISVFVVNMAQQQAIGGHFTPLFSPVRRVALRGDEQQLRSLASCC